MIIKLNLNEVQKELLEKKMELEKLHMMKYSAYCKILILRILKEENTYPDEKFYSNEIKEEV